MGIFYTNTTLQTSERKSVIEFMNKNERTGYISPVINQSVVVFDRESEDQDVSVITNLTSKLSKNLKCVAFTVLVHDGDIFFYWLYQNGKLIDEYNSIPNYFDDSIDPASHGGNVQKLCQAFKKLEALNTVQHLFHQVYLGNVNDDWDEEHLAGEDIHAELVKALELPAITIETGFYSIENDFIDDNFDKASLIRC